MNPSLWHALRDELRWSGDFLIMPPTGDASAPAAAPQEKQNQKTEKEPSGLRVEGSPAENCADMVSGEGNPRARILFVGESLGPVTGLGAQDKTLPAGALLGNIIEKGLGLARDEVHIAHIFGRLQPLSQPVTPEEERQCRTRLKAYVASLRPEVIIALGDVACRCLLAEKTPAGALRGKFHTFENIPLMPTHHPEYLLQNPAKKRETWDDIKQVMVMLGLPLSR